MRIKFCAAPCGSGKTHQIINRACEVVRTHNRVLILQPTRELINRTVQEELLSRPNPPQVRVFHRGTVGDGKVSKALADYVREAPDIPEIVLATHQVLPHVRLFANKSEWHVLIDEALQAVRYQQHRIPQTHNLITDHLDVTPVNAWLAIEDAKQAEAEAEKAKAEAQQLKAEAEREKAEAEQAKVQTRRAEAGAGIEASADIEAKRDIKGYKPGMPIEVVKAKFPNWSNCQTLTPPGVDPNRYITYGCPINPKTLDGPKTKPYELLLFITSKRMTPETVLFVFYKWSSKTQDPKLILLPTLPGNALTAEFDQDIETIKREFSVTEFETCSPPQPALPLCITWRLEDGGFLKYFYTMMLDDIELGLTPPTWLQEREKQAYSGTLPKKF